MKLDCAGKILDLSIPRVMGILNITPDSFYDGGRYERVDAALKQAERMVLDGADILDVGGESTRPGAKAISESEELDRIVPVIEQLTHQFDVPVSIDTSKPAVMRAAVQAGAGLINDVCALQLEGALTTAVAAPVPVCLMHMQGDPRSMQSAPQYGDVVQEVKRFLDERVDACVEAGIDRRRLLLDPGFGFGKTLNHNLQLLKDLSRFTEPGLPLLVGVSRKSMLGGIIAEMQGQEQAAPLEQRLYAGIGAAVMAAMQGARILRVHDVRATKEALAPLCATMMGIT
ncbi:MAG: dihydropteroate synthase [Gammaproteobacteria bacterium]|nr:dihydropteroate synthase [Gammaproteobacteria bacterium]